MLTALITISVLFLATVWVAFVQYSRASKAEDIANILSTNMKTMYEVIEESKEALDNPHLVEAFSNDDEVGKFFNTIKEIQDTLNNFIIEDGEKEESGK